MKRKSSLFVNIRQPLRQADRAAFSLIELLIVMVIIGILASLMLVAGRGVTATVRVSEVVTDISNLGQGIKEFESKFGLTEPFPSRFVIHERYSLWPNAATSTDVAVQRNAAAIRRIWPEFLNNTGRPQSNMFAQDLNGDGDTDDSFTFSGSECLVFFLGGVLQQTTPVTTPPTYLPTGFSTNPLNPFQAGGTRIGPFYDFKSTRLVDTDTTPNGYPEYIDGFPGSVAPYLYFSAYGGRGYRPLGDDRATGAAMSLARNEDEVPSYAANQDTPFEQIYLQRAGTMMMAELPWNPKTYQIISAGVLGQYGEGGIFHPNTGLTSESQARQKLEMDNITNFGGQLNKTP